MSISDFVSSAGSVKNAGGSATEKSVLTPDALAVIQEDLKLDLELYDFVNKRLDAQLQSMEL